MPFHYRQPDVIRLERTTGFRTRGTRLGKVAHDGPPRLSTLLSRLSLRFVRLARGVRSGSGGPPGSATKPTTVESRPRDTPERAIRAETAGLACCGVNPNYFFEDVQVGVEEVSREMVVDRDEMVAYARANDPFLIHVDEDAAAASPFGGLIASGGFTISLWYRLLHSKNREFERVEAALSGFDWHVTFPNPVRAGDRLHLRMTVTEKRLTSKPGRGVVTWVTGLVNQEGTTVLTIEGASLLATRGNGETVPVAP
jgi:acyl dehydratase